MQTTAPPHPTREFSHACPALTQVSDDDADGSSGDDSDNDAQSDDNDGSSGDDSDTFDNVVRRRQLRGSRKMLRL